MDPINPIMPASDLTPRIPRAPAVPRVTPDQQRQEARDDEPGGQEADQRSFDESLEEATSEEFSVPDELLAPERKRGKPSPVEPPSEEQRHTREDEDDDDGPNPLHIDIIA
jgi:hypothetical protein